MLNPTDSSMAANAICHAAEMSREAFRTMLYEYERPSTVHKPKLFIDGNQWCALYGENLQGGVAGFGNTPYAAMLDFDLAWSRPLAAASKEGVCSCGPLQNCGKCTPLRASKEGGI